MPLLPETTARRAVQCARGERVERSEEKWGGLSGKEMGDAMLRRAANDTRRLERRRRILLSVFDFLAKCWQVGNLPYGTRAALAG